MTDTFGEKLRRARLGAGLTQSQLVRRSGIPKPTLSRYENDHVMPSIATLSRLAQALGITQSALLPGEPTPNEELINALDERGIRLRSAAEARRVADIVADAIEAGGGIRRTAGGAGDPPRL